MIYNKAQIAFAIKSAPDVSWDKYKMDRSRRGSMSRMMGSGIALAAGIASGRDAVTAQPRVDAICELDDYVSLRAYTGTASSILLRRPDIAGYFVALESGEPAVDNGGTMIVSPDGRYWARVFSGPISVAWFRGSIQAAIDAAYASSEGRVQLGATHVVSRPVVVRPGISLIGRGPAYAGGTPYSAIPGTTIKASPDFVGEALFESAVAHPDNVLTAVQFEQIRVDLSQCGAHGFRLEDVYDGVVFRNVHAIGADDSRYACWLTSGGYGLGQTAIFENCQFLGRSSAKRKIAPFRADALNESTFINCKFFGASGGATASSGPAMELSGCSGLTLLNPSFAFSAIGVSIEKHPRRKSFGIEIVAPTFEAITECALKIRSSPGERVDSVKLRDPRYYDSVFSCSTAIDVDNVENSDFDSGFKKALVGPDSDQVTVVTQRLSLVSSTGSNTLVLSRPNRIDRYFGIASDVRITGSARVDGESMLHGGVRYRTRVISGVADRIEVADTILLFKCEIPAVYSLPPVQSSTPNCGQMLFVRNIGQFKVTLRAADADSIDSLRERVLMPSESLVIAGDGLGCWWPIKT